MKDRLLWNGDNVAEIQALVGRMQNMDGDVDGERFYPPFAVDDEGEVMWPDGLARVWVEELLAWVPVAVGEWVNG